MQSDIKIYTLGSVKLEKGEETLVEGSSSLSKRWYLYMVLFFHSHETLSIPYLTEKLDMQDNDSPKQSLRMMVYRLRQNFADIPGDEEIIITDNGGYTFNSDIEVWLDIAQFEKFKAQAEEHKENNNWDQAADFFQRAFELYRGPFMEGLEENLWILQQRKKFRSLYMEIVEDLTDILEDRDKYIEAEEVLETALKYCPLETKLHNKMIKITRKAENQYQARKRAEQAVTFFQRNGLEVPEEIEQHLGSQDGPVQYKDPAEFIKENSAAKEDEIVECSPLNLYETYEIMRNSQEHEVNFLNFKIEGEDEPGKLTRAEEVLSEALHDNLDCFSVLCHWQEGHYVVLNSEAEAAEPETIYNQVAEDFHSQNDLTGVELNYYTEEL